MAAGWAAGYEATETQHATVNDWLLTRTDPRPGDTVLDIAAGPGGLSHAASRLVAPNGRVICTDFAPEMVDAARSLGAAQDIDNIDYRTLDGAAVPGGPGPGFHFAVGAPPGASFCVAQAHSGGR